MQHIEPIRAARRTFGQRDLHPLLTQSGGGAEDLCGVAAGVLFEISADEPEGAHGDKRRLRASGRQSPLRAWLLLFSGST